MKPKIFATLEHKNKLCLRISMPPSVKAHLIGEDDAPINFHDVTETTYVESEIVYYIGGCATPPTAKNGKSIQIGASGEVMCAMGEQVLVNFFQAGNIMMHEDELTYSWQTAKAIVYAGGVTCR